MTDKPEPHNKPKSEERKRARLLWLEGGWSQRDIAIELKVNRKTIKRWAKVDKWGENEFKARRKEAYLLWREGGQSQTAIAASLGVTGGAISLWKKQDNWVGRQKEEQKAMMVMTPNEIRVEQELRELNLQEAKLARYNKALGIIERQEALAENPNEVRDDRVVLAANKQALDAIQLIEGKAAPEVVNNILVSITGKNLPENATVLEIDTAALFEEEGERRDLEELLEDDDDDE